MFLEETGVAKLAVIGICLFDERDMMLTDKTAGWILTGVAAINLLGSTSGSYGRSGKANTSYVIGPYEIFSTKSSFSEELIQKMDHLKYKTRVIVDGGKDACQEDEVRQQGREGVRTTFVKKLSFEGEYYGEEVVKIEVVEPESRILVKGEKKVFKSLETPNGPLNYWCKLEGFLATSYDSTCKGCDLVTATGMRQGYGVVAVDPKVIPLYSKLYVPGYGMAVAGDTGGLIKGKRIDLGYDSLMGQWSRRVVDVYLTE